MTLSLAFNSYPGPSQKGFSFITLVVAILILSLTLGLSIVSLRPSLERDRTQETFSRIDDLLIALDEYRRHNAGALPSSLDDLLETTGTPCTVDPTDRKLQGWCGPYVDQVFQENQSRFKMDGWGNEFQLTASQFISCGANGICGDDDDIAVDF